jgi:Peptidase_C39 like family
MSPVCDAISKQRIASTARSAGIAVLAGTAALALAVGPAVGTARAGELYGDPAAAAPFWRYQELDDDCVEVAAADVVGELTGHEPSEQEMVKLAQTTPSPSHSGPIYTKPKKRKHGEGTSYDDAPTLLAHYGVKAVSTDKGSAKETGVPTGMAALEQDLAHGRKVIAAVNAELIWREPVEDKDSDGEPESNHAVVVTGVDTIAGMVHLNDSGSENGRDEQVPIAIFIKSWNTSDDQMTVTS